MSYVDSQGVEPCVGSHGTAHCSSATPFVSAVVVACPARLYPSGALSPFISIGTPACLCPQWHPAWTFTASSAGRPLW